MDRDQLDHILRASQDITNEREFVIVGSQAALAQLPRLPGVMGMSPEIDIYPRNRPELWGEIDGAIGALSDFASTHGFYADGVDQNTAKFPAGWESRAVRYSGPGAKGAIATAPEIHDLAAGKLVAGREKDLEWVSESVRSGLVRPDRLQELVPTVPAEKPFIDQAMRRLADIGKLAPDPAVDAVQLDPAAPRSARAAVSAGLNDVELLRKLHATEMACQAAKTPADQLRYLEGFKELRKAARERLLQPDPQQSAAKTAQRSRDPGRGGPSL